MDDSVILVVVVLLLLLPLMYYMYNNRKISLSCPVSFKDYYALSPIKYWGYNLSYTVYYPYAPNYAFDIGNYSANSWATPRSYAPIANAVAKKMVNGVPSTVVADNDRETADLLDTLRLFSHKTKIGDWLIYNCKTKDAWAWSPTGLTVPAVTVGTVTIPSYDIHTGGFWYRIPYDPTNSVFSGPNKKQLLDYLAFLYLVLDKGGMGSTPFPYSGEFKYWGKV